MVPPEIIRQVAEASDIVDVVQEYFPLEKSGSQFKALSPFTNEKSASFYVTPSKQAFYCFSSQQGGDVFKFVQLYENVSFGLALKKLAERANIPLPEERADPKQAAKQRLRRKLQDLHVHAREFFHLLLLRSEDAESARDYLKSRGINSETAKRWKLGYAPEHSGEFFRWAEQRDFPADLLLESGLARRSDRNGGIYAHFRHRLMFPIANDYGEPIAFSGRVLSKDQKGGKYINSPETAIFLKSRHFFGFDQTKQSVLKAGHAVLCEGQLDLIMAFEHGVTNLIAPLGTAFTDAHARLLRRHTSEVVICFDADRAGQKATEKAFAELTKEGVSVRVARMPPGEDPDSLIRQSGAEAFQKVIDDAEEYFDAQISLKNDLLSEGSIRDRVEFARSLAEQAGLMGDGMKRGLLLDRIASRLGLQVEDLRAIATESAGKAAQRAAHPPSRAQSSMNQDPDSTGTPETQEEPFRDLYPKTHVIQVFCRLLLSSREVRDWVLEHGKRELLDSVEDTDLLAILWDGQLDPEDAASRNAFLESLPKNAERAATRLLLAEGLTGDLDLAKDCCLSLERKALHNRAREKKARLKVPSQLTEEELMQLLQDVAELERQLKDLPASRTKDPNVG
ncbi:MAG: DNA primase [Verrucomicrobiota bacterium]